MPTHFGRLIAAPALLVVMGACSGPAERTKPLGRAQNVATFPPLAHPSAAQTSHVPTASVPTDLASAPAAQSSAQSLVQDPCTFTSDKNLTMWSDEDWKKCARTQCSRGDLHNTLSVSIGIPDLSGAIRFDKPKEFMSGVTDLVHLQVRNISQSDVEVPLLFAADVSPPAGPAAFRSQSGALSDSGDGCLSMGRCVVLVLKPGVAYGYNVIAIPMHRRSSECGPLLPTTKLKPGEYTLEVRTHINALAPIVGSQKVLVRAHSSQVY